MIPSGSTTPVGGNQNGTPPTLLRTNSGILGGQGVGGGPGQQQQHQQGFPSLLGSRNQYSNLNMLGGGGGTNSGIQGFNSGGVPQPNNNVGVPPSLQRAMAMANDSLPLSSPLIRPGTGSQFANPSDQHDQQKFQHGQHQQGQDLISSFQLQSQGQGILGARNMQQFQNQLQPYRSLPNEQFRNLSAMKLDPQQLQSLRNLSVKMEQPQSHGDPSMLIQQQQLLQFPRQNPSQQMQIQAYLQHQQRLLQQQQIMQAFPRQRPQMQQPPLQQLQQQNSPVPMALKSPGYESGVCARRLMQYMCQQQRRPEDNNIEFWRKFVDDFFAPHAKKRWCVSQYGSGRQTTGVFPQDVWQCEICGTKPGKGFETTVEVLPRLCKIKYDSGTLEELLYVDMPREYPTPSGHIVLEYGKAIQESVFEQLRVVRDGQLRIVFSSDLKICSWEFCARSHEELIPRRLLIPQVSQLGAIAQKHQASVQNGSTTPPAQDLQSNFNMFVATARQLVKALEVPLVNDLGYTKRYVRCLQISEVVNSMKDLIDFSRENKIGPIASLNSFPRRTSTPVQNQGTPQQEHSVPQTAAGSEQGNGQPSATHINTNNNVNNPASTSSQANSPSVLAGIIHQNSVNNRQNGSSAFTNSVHAPSGSSVHVPQSQISPSSSVPNSGSSASNSMQASPASTLTSTSAQMPSISASTSLMQQPAVPPEDIDPNDQESSVQHFIQEMMMSSQMNGGSPFQASVGATNMGVNSAVGNDLKSLQGSVVSNNGSSGLKGANGFGSNCLANNASMDFNNLGPIDSVPNPVNGIRHSMAITNNNVTLNGRAGVSSLQSLSLQDANLNLQQDLGGSRLLNGLGSAGTFNSLQFDWKSP